MLLPVEFRCMCPSFSPLERLAHTDKAIVYCCGHCTTGTRRRINVDKVLHGLTALLEVHLFGENGVTPSVVDAACRALSAFVGACVHHCVFVSTVLDRTTTVVAVVAVVCGCTGVVVVPAPCCIVVLACVLMGCWCWWGDV